VRAKSAKLDQAVLDSLSNVEVAIAAIPAPFSKAVVDDTPVVKSAFDVAADLKKTWNSDVSSALGATLKPSDNDGD
jgi:hypothetical protein